MNIEAQTKEALTLLSESSRGYFTVWSLSGDANRKRRVQIMCALHGVDKYPVAKSGITAMEKALHHRVSQLGGAIVGRSIRDRDECFQQWAKDFLAQ